MASNQRIDDLIAQQAFEQVERLTTQLGGLQSQLVAGIKQAKLFSDTLAGAKGLREINTNAANASKELEKLARLQAQTTKAQQDLAKAAAQREAAEIRLAAAQDRQTAASNKQAEAAKKASQAYQVLNSAYQEATALARNVGAQFGENSDQFLKASKSANFLREKLDAIDKPLGNYQRNVGNYKSGTEKFSGAVSQLGNAFTQITRELPAFANSAQTGFLAISNNLPILFDQLSNINKVLKETNIAQAAAAGEQAKQTALAGGASEEAAGQIGELASQTALAAAEGQRGKAAFAAIAKSLFSFQTLLSLGVVLLTVYGKQMVDFIGSLFQGTEALDIFTEKQNAFNEAIKSADFKKGIEQFYELSTNINLAKDGLVDKESALTQYNETIGKTAGFAKTFNEAEKLTLERGEKVLQLIILKTAAQNLLAKASEKAAERAIELNKTDLESASFVDRIKGGLSFDLPGLFESADAVRKREAQQTLKSQQELGAIRRAQNAANLKKEEEQFFKAFQTLQKNAAEYAKKNNLSFTDLTKTDKGGSKSTISPKSTASEDELRALEYQYEQQIALAREQDKELAELEKEYIQQIKNYRKDAYESSVREFEDYGQKALESTEDSLQAQTIALEESYAKGKISKSEYEKQKLDIEYEANRQSLEIQLSTISQIIALQESLGMDVSDSKKKLSDLTRKLAKADADYEIAQIKSVAEARKALNSAVKELATQAFNLGVTLVNASYENEKNRIQEQSDAIDVKRDKDIKEVDRQLLSEQDKADKIAVINAKAQAQKDLLDQRKRQVAERQAKFDKAVSLANIVQNTYAGAARALKDYPFPFSSIIAGLVIATGLAQAAQIIATPIPKYAKGTDYHKGGPMIVGDAGEELVIEPNGRKYITPDTDTLTMAPKGTKVIPNHELIKMMATPDRVQYVGGQAVDMTQVVGELKRNTQAIKQQKMASTLITKSGWRNQQLRVSNWNAYKQNRLN